MSIKISEAAIEAAIARSAIKACEICGQTFIPKDNRQKLCPECSELAHQNAFSRPKPARRKIHLSTLAKKEALMLKTGVNYGVIQTYWPDEEKIRQVGERLRAAGYQQIRHAGGLIRSAEQIQF